MGVFSTHLVLLIQFWHQMNWKNEIINSKKISFEHESDTINISSFPRTGLRGNDEIFIDSFRHIFGAMGKASSTF